MKYVLYTLVGIVTFGLFSLAGIEIYKLITGQAVQILGITF